MISEKIFRKKSIFPQTEIHEKHELWFDSVMVYGRLVIPEINIMLNQYQ